MNIYEYNSSTINTYSKEDFGFLSTSSLEIEDCGNLSNDIIDTQNYYDISCNETLVPFGLITVFGSKTKYIRTRSIFKKYIDLNSKSIILNKVILRWIGFSIIFQLSNDLERNVIPDVSGGGEL
jgi:hypothetical protein